MRKLAATAVLAAAAGSANADIVDLVMFSITATDLDTNSSITQVFTIEPGAGDGSGDVFWSLGDQLDLGAIGGLESASILVSSSGNRGGSGVQSVVADFSVFSTTQNASFQINSAVVSFSAIPAATAQGFASAAIIVNDVQGNGVSLTPGVNGGYNAFINGNSSFAALFAGGALNAAGAYSEDTGSFLPTGVAVTSISAGWDFALSSFDSATGTSTFTVVPAPASAALLGLGGLVATRRRR